MPANKKYLATPKQQFLKTTAAILGGYLVSTTFHMALVFFFNPVTVIITSSYSSFLLWVGLMVVAFLAKNGWKIWALYIILSLLFSTIIFFGKLYFPIA